MNFLKKLITKKESPIKTYEDFWIWFQNNEKDFHKVVKSGKNIDEDFFEKISPKLDAIKEGFFYLTGMYTDEIVELILTADGNLNNILFVEELVAVAPNLKNWKFTALKPASKIEDVNINMAGYRFHQDNMHFYSNEWPEYPDEIDITIIHDDYNEENKDDIINGTYIFLDNYLGELNSVTLIDNIQFIEKHKSEKELVPISKLNYFLIWREKEFLEKYEGVRTATEDDNYSLFNAQGHNGSPIVAVFNTDLLEWDSKASHPWIAKITIAFNGSENDGMPDDHITAELYEIEEKLVEELKDFEGYLNIGRQTGEGVRRNYFGCKDFRKPSRIFFDIQKTYADKFEIEYDIYKDKYWQTFEKFSRI